MIICAHSTRDHVVIGVTVGAHAHSYRTQSIARSPTRGVGKWLTTAASKDAPGVLRLKGRGENGLTSDRAEEK